MRRDHRELTPLSAQAAFWVLSVDPVFKALRL